MNTLAIRADWSGRVLEGRFVLLEWLGSSEQSGVFLTELEGEPRQKAVIKLIPADAGDAEARIAGWAAAAALSHPHLMRVFSSGRCEVDGASLLYVVTEFADEVLSEIIPARPLTPQEAREMLLPMLDVLEYLHGKGFVHGHLKPSNIMAVGDQLKLSGDSILAAGGRVMQYLSPGLYDAPECVADPISPAADVWSLGITLVEVLNQNPLLWDRSANTEPVVPESVPEPFAGIARECLRLDPAERCVIRDVRARLDRARPCLEPVSKPPGRDSALDAPRRTGKAPRGWFRVMAITAGVLLVFAIVALLLMRTHKAERAPRAEKPENAPAAAAVPPQTTAAETQPSTGVKVEGAVAAQVLPEVLPQAMESIQGTIKVSVRLTVDASGQVSDASLETPGPSKYFAKVALDAARHWKFKPAEMNGKAVPSNWILQFKFRQTGTDVAPVETAP